MKRTMGWLLAVAMSGTACAQQREAPAAPPAPAAPVAPAAPPAPAAAPVRPSVSAGTVILNSSEGTLTLTTNDDENPTLTPPRNVRITRAGGASVGSTLTVDGKRSFTLTPAESDPAADQVRALQGYMSAIDQYSHSNRDATTTAVAAVMQAAEMLKTRGADAQIDYFTKVLSHAENETVQRAIRLQLIDAYKRAGQTDKALDELKTLIVAAPEKNADHNTKR